MNSTKKCSQCGSQDLFFNEADFLGGHNGALLPGVFGMFGAWEKVDVVVCGQCGHIMWFLKQDSLDGVKKRWKPLDKET